MKHKTFFLFLLFYSFIINAQKDSGIEHKNAFGWNLYSMNHQLTKFELSFKGSFNPDYYGAHTNASTDYSIWYKREFKLDSLAMRIFIQPHFMMSYRFGDIQVDSVTDARVYEEFLRFPLMFGMKLSAGKSIDINMSFGLVYSILSKQKYLARPTVTLPAMYQKQ